MIPFGEWLPDLPSYGGHASVAKNVIAAASSIPGGTSYKPFPSLTAFSLPLDNICLGAFAAKGVSGVPTNFAGTKNALYKLNGNQYEDISRSTPYSGNDESMWSFTVFGDRLIATNYADYPQSYVIGTSTSFSDLTTVFKSKFVANVRDFVFHGYINETSGSIRPNMVWWSAINDPTDYVPSVSTQCDFQEIFGEGEQGEITGIVGGEYATVFMEGGVHRFTYVGGSTIFSRDQIVYGVGCIAPGSIASHGSFIFYLGPDGFYLLQGTTIIPIGKNKVDKWFFNDLDKSLLIRVNAVIDPINSIYLVAYPGSGNNGYCNRILAYNWVTQKWTLIEPGDIEKLVLSVSSNVDFDDASAAALYDYPDTSSISEVMLDSRMFVGGQIQLSAFDSSNSLGHFNSSSMQATIETAETQIFDGYRALITHVVPHVENYGSMTVEIGGRERHNQDVSYTSPVSVGSDGEADVLSNARYQRGRVVISDGFSIAYGLDVMARKTGRY